MAIRMELSRVLIRELRDHQIIELREMAPVETPTASGSTISYSQMENGRSFPIVIGLSESLAIERRLKGIAIKRPQTHELLMSIIDSLGATVESISIHDVKDHTFYAKITVTKADGAMIDIDARPSDAIAVGIAADVPLYVEEHVLDSARDNAQ